MHEIQKLELQKKDKKKKQLEHNAIIYYGMIALGILNYAFIEKNTRIPLKKAATYIINNAEDYADTTLKQEDESKLYKPFEKVGMTNNKQHEDVVLDLAIYSSLIYLADIERINNIRDETVAYKNALKEIAKLKAIKNLTNRFVKHISLLSLMEFCRLYEGEKASWDPSFSIMKRKQHIAVYNKTFIVGIGMNIPYSISEVVVFLPYKGLHPMQLINCKCGMTILSVNVSL